MGTQKASEVVLFSEPLESHPPLVSLSLCSIPFALYRRRENKTMEESKRRRTLAFYRVKGIDWGRQAQFEHQTFLEDGCLLGCCAV
jgi:hypothetical protein